MPPGNSGEDESVILRGVETDRVAPDGCPPRAPTDPNVRNERIRLLMLSLRCATADRVNRHGNLAQERQAHDGEVDTQATSSLEYAPADGANQDVPDNVRLAGLITSKGRAVADAGTRRKRKSFSPIFLRTLLLRTN
jgi:hypothetical protein